MSSVSNSAMVTEGTRTRYQGVVVWALSYRGNVRGRSGRRRLRWHPSRMRRRADVCSRASEGSGCLAEATLAVEVGLRSRMKRGAGMDFERRRSGHAADNGLR